MNKQSCACDLIPSALGDFSDGAMLTSWHNTVSQTVGATVAGQSSNRSPGGGSLHYLYG